MASSRAQQAAIAISMKKAGKKPKMQKGGSSTTVIKRVSPTDPYQVELRRLEKQKRDLEIAKIQAKRKREAESNRLLKEKLDRTRRLSKGGAIKMAKGGSTPAWTRKEGKSPTGGLNAKGVASYRAANPGSKLQTAVTTKPSKLKPGSKDAKRRKSFCARMSGMPGPMKDEKGRPTRKALSLRKWNC